MMESFIKSVSPMAGKVVSAAIERLNDAAIDAMLQCANTNDPLAPLLLGVKREVLDEVKNLRRSEFMVVSRTHSLSLVKLRFNDPAVWRMLKTGGFSKELVLRELTKEDSNGERSK